MTPETLALRELLDAHRDEFLAILDRYGATSPKLFGSVARGNARTGSDIDILVEMDPADGNLLMRASGLMEETLPGVSLMCSRPSNDASGMSSHLKAMQARQRWQWMRSSAICRSSAKP